MNTMAEFASQLAAEAETRGLRIVIEPIRAPYEATQMTTNPAPETHETKPVSQPTEAISVPKIVESPYNNRKKEAVREANSWITVAQCARMLNISTSVIYNRIRSGIIPSRRNVFGVMTVNTNLLEELPESLGSRNGRSVPVECVETGRRYTSMAQASRRLKVSVPSLQKAMVSGEMLDGYHFRQIETD